MLTVPQRSFPDETSKVLFPACLAPDELSALFGAILIAADYGNFTEPMSRAWDALWEAQAFIEQPYNAECFDLCAYVDFWSFDAVNGEVMLQYFDSICGTTYWYPWFCDVFFNAAIAGGGVPEAMFTYLMDKYAEYCGLELPPIEPFKDVCDLMTEALGTSPTKAEVNALLDSCGITVPADYDWTHHMANTPTNPGWVAWSSTPYTNVPAQRTRFAWNSTNGIYTTYGTSGEPGSVTQRHRLYAKIPYTTTDLEQITVRIVNPYTEDGTVQFYLHNAGVQIEATAAMTVPANMTQDFILPNLSGNSNLFSLVITGGATMNASHSPIRVPYVDFRGRGTSPF